MAVLVNTQGTTRPEFQLGLGGPSLLQGTGAPSGALGSDGDIYIQTGPPQRVFQKVSGFWLDLHSTSWSLVGAVQNVGSNSTKFANHGAINTETGITMLRLGAILGVSINLSTPRTGGTLSAAAVVNGVPVTGSGYVLQIDGNSTQRAWSEFSPPVVYQAGDVVTAGLQTNSFSPSTADATLCVFCRDVP